MKSLRFCCMVALVMALLMGLSCPASAAKLPVGVNLFGSATDGIIDTEEYTQVFPDGTTFTPYSLPNKKMLIMQNIWVTFTPTTPFTPPVKFVIPNSVGTGPHIFGHNLVANSGNTFASFETAFTPGLAINFKPVMKVIDAEGVVIPGTLQVRILGIVQ